MFILFKLNPFLSINNTMVYKIVYTIHLGHMRTIK